MSAKLSGLQNKNIENILIKDTFTLGIGFFSEASSIITFIQFLENLLKIKDNEDKMFENDEGLLMSELLKKNLMGFYYNEKKIKLEIAHPFILKLVKHSKIQNISY